MSEQNAPATVTRLVSRAKLRIGQNVRTKSGLDKTSLSELADSIKTKGLLQPILVARAPGFESVPFDDAEFIVIAGQRRTLACEIADVTPIPVIEQDGTDGADLKAKQIVENLHRENLSLAETCGAAREMLAILGKPADVVKALNKSKAWVSKHLTPTGPNFPAEVRELMNDGDCQDLETLLALGQIAKTAGGANVLPALIEQAKAGDLTRVKTISTLTALKAGATEEAGESEGDGEGENDRESDERKEKFGRLELAEGTARGILTALRFYKNNKSNSRAVDAAIAHVEAFIETTWPKAD